MVRHWRRSRGLLPADVEFLTKLRDPEEIDDWLAGRRTRLCWYLFDFSFHTACAKLTYGMPKITSGLIHRRVKEDYINILIGFVLRDFIGG